MERSHKYRLARACAAVLLALLLHSYAYAATFVVDSLGDQDDQLPGDHQCLTGLGTCTLRAAIQEANSLFGADTIQFAVTATIVVTSALPPIVDGSASRPLFTITTNQPVEISGLTLTRAAAASGGALTVASGSTVTVTRCALTDSSATGNGGAVHNSGSLTLVETTVSGNRAGGAGGGIYNAAGATLALTNSTFGGNTADTDGGGLANVGTATLLNVTLADNLADDDNNGSSNGGGIWDSGSATTTLKNTLLARNADRGGQSPECAGSVGSQGFNLLQRDTGCTFAATGNDVVNPATTLILGALRDNGGPTLTHALLFGSPAIDAGTNTGCPATDQRGIARPLNGTGSATCDIGASTSFRPPRPAQTCRSRSAIAPIWSRPATRSPILRSFAI